MARDRVSESLAHLNHPAQSQYAEQPGECVFTTEGSVRTAMLAVWGLTGLDKPIVPPTEPYYDIRVLADNVKVMTGNEKLTTQALSALADGPTSSVPTEIVSLLSQIPEAS